MTDNQIVAVVFYSLAGCAFMALLAVGAFLTDVILPKHPKLCEFLDKVIDNL